MANLLNFKLPFDYDVAAYLKSSHPEVVDYRIRSKSLDARGAPRGKKPFYLYQLEVIHAGEQFSNETKIYHTRKQFLKAPIIVGAGPAGLFAALRFAEYGIKTRVIERGEDAQRRMLHISKYWRKGELNTESNVCFGEGGAGLFSDGKLITRVKSPFIQYVMDKFVAFGAPAEVAYISNPHLGSNKIRKIITKISDFLKGEGHEIDTNVKAIKILFEGQRAVGVRLADGTELFSEHIILACGHSAGEMYHQLAQDGVSMKPKDFAVGVRIEHPRVEIDRMQHGRFAQEMEAARYRLSYHNKETDKGTYSFCMCPGGYVLSSGTETDGIVVNGMSNYARNSRWSNSALVVSVKAGEDFDISDVLGGMDFQHQIEQKAFQLSKQQADGRKLPAMTVREFLDGKLNHKALPKTSSPSGIFKTDIRQIFPDFINQHLRVALLEFNQKLKGFAYDEALLIAPETRTSAPVTITRDKENLVSPSHAGLYPCGEGAGYAGGITSAAVDGIKVVEAILASHEL